MFEVVIMSAVCVLLLSLLTGDSQMAEPLSRYSMAYWLPAPASVFITSPFLEFLRWDLGRYFLRAGLLAFFVWLHRSYGSKLFGRKLGKFRHISLHQAPQYLSLGLSASASSRCGA